MEVAAELSRVQISYLMSLIWNWVGENETLSSQDSRALRERYLVTSRHKSSIFLFIKTLFTNYPSLIFWEFVTHTVMTGSGKKMGLPFDKFSRRYVFQQYA